MQTFDIPFCDEYTSSIEFKTNLVRHYDLTEQRKACWILPKREFRLNLEMSPENHERLESLFRVTKGDYEPIFWCWPNDKGGANIDYKCFFDEPTLAQTNFPLGYSSSAVTLSMIDDRNILPNRYFLREEHWIYSGNFTRTPQNLSYSGSGRLSQLGVLQMGQNYLLRAKLQNTQGGTPYLSADSASYGLERRALYEGESLINFNAISSDFSVEIPDGASGCFCELSLFKIGEIQSVFDFEYNLEHKSEINFLNLKDTDLTYAANRQNICENPIRRWVLALELPPVAGEKFETFFVAQKGRYKAFTWNYNGESINVRFDTDKLDQKHYALGFREVKIPIIEVL